MAREKAAKSSARDIRGPSPLIAIEDEPAVELSVHQQLSDPLSRGELADPSHRVLAAKTVSFVIPKQPWPNM